MKTQSMSSSMTMEPTPEGPVMGSLPPTTAGWQASLFLRLRHDGQRTTIAERRHEGPLVIQRPFHPRGHDPCQVVLIHPPGGVVAGDGIRLEIEAGPATQALVTTPGATKFYRSTGSEAGQQVRLRVGRGAVLEWTPQEAILFDGARARIDTRVDLAKDARFLGWEICALGRPASRLPFATGSCHQRFEVHREGRPLFIDRTRFEGGAESLHGRFGLAGRSAVGVLVCEGAEGLGDDALRRAVDDAGRSTVLAGGSRMGDVYVVRALADQARAIFDFFSRIRDTLREPLFGGRAPAARIWST